MRSSEREFVAMRERMCASESVGARERRDRECVWERECGRESRREKVRGIECAEGESTGVRGTGKERVEARDRM